MTLDLEQTLQKRLDESSARKLSQLVSSHAQNAGADMRAVFFHFAAHDWMTNRFFFVSLATKNMTVNHCAFEQKRGWTEGMVILSQYRMRF